MSLLTMCQDVCAAINLPRPSAIASSSDDTARQLLALAKESLLGVAARGPWQELTKEVTFSTVVNTTSYALSGIASDIDYVISNTFWNRTKRWQVNGPYDEQEWQKMQASVVTSPWDHYRMRGKSIILFPAPSATNTMAFEYITTNRCTDSGGTGQTTWAADTDLTVIDEYIHFLDLRWRFLKAKGLQYGDELAEFEEQADKKLVRKRNMAVLSMRSQRPVIGSAVIPEGSWNLS